MERRLLVCDACGDETDLYESDGWLQVRTYIASYDFMDMVRGRRESAQDDGTNHGDFCSLTCLSSWANTQDVLRGLGHGEED